MKKQPTLSKSKLRKALIDKISKVDKEEDLVSLNNVLDKYLQLVNESLSPKEVFGKDWIDLNRKAGKTLQGLRFREGMTQTDLAKALKGVKQANISSWENGKEKIPQKRIEQLSKIFKTDLGKLIKN